MKNNKKNDYLDIVNRYPDVDKDDLRELYKQKVGNSTKILLAVYAIIIPVATFSANYNNFSENWLLYSSVAIIVWILLVIISYALIQSLWNPKKEFEKYLAAVKKLETYLFSLEPGHKQHLEGSSINEAMRKAFEKNKVSLSNNANITKEDDRNWKIKDGDNTYKIEYTETQLNIYKEP
jgi:low affinity Fe/Cu permease